MCSSVLCTLSGKLQGCHQVYLRSLLFVWVAFITSFLDISMEGSALLGTISAREVGSALFTDLSAIDELKTPSYCSLRILESHSTRLGHQSIGLFFGKRSDICLVDRIFSCITDSSVCKSFIGLFFSLDLLYEIRSNLLWLICHSFFDGGVISLNCFSPCLPPAT